MSQMVESWHHWSALMAVSTESFLGQLIHSLLQLIASSLTRASLRLILHDMASPEMSAWDPSLYSDSASCIWWRIAFFSSCFPLLSRLPAQWPLSTGSATSSRHTYAESCWLELQNENEAGSCISYGYSASLPVTLGVNLL